MWLVLFLSFNIRFGFGFHCSQPFFIVNYVFIGYITIEKYSFNVCVLHLTRIIFFPSLLLLANSLSPNELLPSPNKSTNYKDGEGKGGRGGGNGSQGKGKTTNMFLHKSS